MTIRSILLFVAAESAQVDCGPAAYAISLARFHGAQLTIMCAALDVTSPESGADAHAIACEIAKRSKATGVECRVIIEHSHAIGISDVVAEHARVHDLCVCGVSKLSLVSERQIAEGLLFASGRPVLVVPASWDLDYSADTVAAAWDNTAKAARALGDAITLLGPKKVQIVTIQGEKSLPTDMNPRGLVSALNRRGVEGGYLQADLAGRKVATALAEEAANADASLLVMGGFAHSRLRQFVLGGATAQVLDRPLMPTLLSH